MPGGYGRIGLGGRGEGVVYAHRASWLLFKGEIPEGVCVLHKCDTPQCVNPEHLFLGTIQDNNRDMVEKGRHAHCETSGTAKLSLADVACIRQLRHDGRTLTEIADLFAVTESNVGYIVRRDTWSERAA